jgi:DNA mismatch endonuclease (patch repair protein)
MKTDPARSAIMRAVKGRDTGIELQVRSLLHRQGFRFRLHRADLPGKPDIILPGRKAVVFVHGCFWHGHTCRRGARVPKTNRDYWVAKISRNRVRDRKHRTGLKRAGWNVFTVWECEIGQEKRLASRLLRSLSPLTRIR